VAQQQLQERYQQLEWPQQIGNLASTLARISSRSSSPQYDAWSQTYYVKPHRLLSGVRLTCQRR
jgi:hypothetical protein